MKAANETPPKRVRFASDWDGSRTAIVEQRDGDMAGWKTRYREGEPPGHIAESAFEWRRTQAWLGTETGWVWEAWADHGTWDLRLISPLGVKYCVVNEFEVKRLQPEDGSAG